MNTMTRKLSRNVDQEWREFIQNPHGYRHPLARPIVKQKRQIMPVKKIPIPIYFYSYIPLRQIVPAHHHIVLHTSTGKRCCVCNMRLGVLA